MWLVIFIFILIIWLTIIMVISMIDYLTMLSKNSIILKFSLIYNFNKLFNERSEVKGNKIADFFDFIRVQINLNMVISHFICMTLWRKFIFDAKEPHPYFDFTNFVVTAVLIRLEFYN